MKRVAAGLIAGIVLSAGATIAVASHVGEYMPAECTDVHAGTDIRGGGDGTRVTYTTPGIVTTDLILEGPSCLGADYTVITYDEPGGTPVVLDAISFPGDGSSSAFTIRRSITDDDGAATPRVCVNIVVSTSTSRTEVVTDTSGSSSTQPGSGDGDAPPFQDNDTDTDTISVETETVVDWGAENLSAGEAIRCIPVQISTPGGSGAKGYN